MRVIGGFILLLISGCSDWQVNSLKDDVETPPDTDTDSPIEGQDTGDTDSEEICNGEDDDGDGLIDEGFRDSDGDGVADCEDEDCDVSQLPELSVTVPEECESVTVSITDPWNVAIE